LEVDQMLHLLTRLVALALILAIVPAAAQGRRLAIVGQDDRVRVDSRDPFWDAVGQVNVSGYRRAFRCTGTLVRSDVVVTAAHCLMDPWTRAPFSLADIHFVAGVRGSDNKGHAKAQCLKFPKGYVYVGPDRYLPRAAAQKVPLHAFAQDAVAIVLDRKLSPAPAPLADLVVARSELLLTHAAYPADRRFALTAHFNCRWRATQGPLWFTDCDTHPAGSGGPVFATVDGAMRIAAVMVGGIEGAATIALPLSVWADLVKDNACP
jgi:protease YdgD